MAPFRLAGFMDFPACQQSARHYWQINALDEEDTPVGLSQVGKIIRTATQKRKMKHHVSGRFALQLIEMPVHGP